MALLTPVEVNNSSKVVLSFGPKGDEVIWNGILGVSNVFIENFNFIKFYSSNLQNQQNVILEIIVNSLVKLSNNNNVVSNIINETAKKVAEAEFNVKIKIKKLSKITPNKLYEINVYRCVNSIDGECWVCEMENKIIKKWR